LVGVGASAELDAFTAVDEVSDTPSGCANGSDFDLDEHPATDRHTSVAAAATRTRTKTSIK
jgi:hypothetical protein